VTPRSNVTEAYAFACLNCGHGWEQKYEIAHRTDASGRPVVTYLVDGVKVPSPLTRPTCQNCEGHLLRIMRSGKVAHVASPASDGPPEPEAARRHSMRPFLHRRHGPADPHRAGRTERPERTEDPERPERLGRAERPERPERPD